MSIDVLLERALPISDEVLEQIKNGQLSVHGGVIRRANGQIFKHIIVPQDIQQQELSKQLLSEKSMTLGLPTNSIEGQVLGLAAVNIVALKQATTALEAQLQEISVKLDTMQASIDIISQHVEFQSFVKVTDIRSKVLGAIEEALLASLKVDDINFLRVHLMPLRQAYNDRETLLKEMLGKMSNLELIQNLEFLMLSIELFNMAGTVLSQMHIKLSEDDLADAYLERITNINIDIRTKFEALKKTGCFSPHIISKEQIELFKIELVGFKRAENTTHMLLNQSRLCLEHQFDHKELLKVSGNEVLMLEPLFS